VAAIRHELASLAALDPATRHRRRILRFDGLASVMSAVTAETASHGKTSRSSSHPRTVDVGANRAVS
jgi:hypothetical protein